ncbi:MAG TPA: hypothetical protein VGR90_10375, partial [Acidimicrobiales bacterium]|nr:hypothetical protein [Acidimicrobiales bacterium]
MMNARWVFRTFKTSLCVLVVGVLSSTALAACSGGSGKASSADKAKVREIREPNSNPANTTPGTGGTLGYTPTGTIVASDGFDPTKDGFSWENYGDTLPTDKGMAAPGNTAATNLTPAALRKIFGDSVCANSHCDLTPEAQAWMDQINNSMMDGHCYGFSD